MKILKWYSPIWLSICTLFLFQDFDDTALWAVILLAPVLVYLWTLALKK